MITGGMSQVSLKRWVSVELTESGGACFLV